MAEEWQMLDGRVIEWQSIDECKTIGECIAIESLSAEGNQIAPMAASNSVGGFNFDFEAVGDVDVDVDVVDDVHDA